MRRLEDILEERLRKTAYLGDALESGLINVSALARAWRPWLSTHAYKDVTEHAISMALRRLVAEKKLRSGEGAETFPAQKIILQPSLSETVIAHSPRVHQIARKLHQIHERRGGEGYLHVSHGLRETTIIASSELQKDLEKLIDEEKVIKHIEDLSSTTLLFPSGTEEVSGVYYPFFRALAWERISIVETLSTWTELTFIVREIDAEEALGVVQQLVE